MHCQAALRTWFSLVFLTACGLASGGCMSAMLRQGANDGGVVIDRIQSGRATCRADVERRLGPPAAITEGDGRFEAVYIFYYVPPVSDGILWDEHGRTPLNNFADSYTPFKVPMAAALCALEPARVLMEAGRHARDGQDARLLVAYLPDGSIVPGSARLELPPPDKPAPAIPPSSAP